MKSNNLCDKKLLCEHDRHGRFALANEMGERLTDSRLYFEKMKPSRVVKSNRSNLTKRTFDIVLAVIFTTFFSPLFALIAALIKITDSGPVLFWQTRVGQGGKTFQLPKFRSMRVDAEALKPSLLNRNVHPTGVTFKMVNDPRITWIGRIIRKTSLDEFPQLWCVLKGEMSLVGPRPPIPSEVEKYSPSDRRRLDVKPGLTCIWQVSGRSDLSFEKQVEMDLEYIERQSLWLDVKLILKTIPVVLMGKGAY